MKYSSFYIFTTFFWCAIFCNHSAVAQQAITTTSNETTIDGNLYGYTIGEMVLVDTYSSADFLLTQGFLQPSENVSIHVTETEWQESGLLLFPNPFSQDVQIQLNNGESGSFGIEILDASGRLIFSERLIFSGVRSSHTLDLSDFSAGIYIIKATTQTNTTNNTYISRLIKN